MAKIKKSNIDKDVKQSEVLYIVFFFFFEYKNGIRCFPGAQMVKNLPAVQEIQVQSLGWEGLLKKGMATTPIFLPGESHGQRSLAGYSPWDCKESGMTERLTLSKWY